MAHTLRSILWSVAGILVCGIAGGYCGWWVGDALGLAGVFAALVGVIVAMVVATAAWVGLTVVLRKLGVVS
jgi:hypothetical protein